MITIDLEQLKHHQNILNALIEGGKFSTEKDDTNRYMKILVQLLNSIQTTLEDEEKVQFTSKPQIKVLVNIRDASFESLSSTHDLHYVVVDCDDNGDEPVVVSNISSPDKLIGAGEKFFTEIFKGRTLDAEDKRAKQLLKEIDF